MSWNYRLVRYRNGSGFGLHEVFYADHNPEKPKKMTRDPVSFGPYENADELRQSLKMALYDVTNRPIFNEPEPGGWFE